MDRLGQDDEFESSADTALDLWVYLNKYLCWLSEIPADPRHVDDLLKGQLDTAPTDCDQGTLTEEIRVAFEEYLMRMEGVGALVKSAAIKRLALKVAPLARDLWIAEWHAVEEKPHATA